MKNLLRTALIVGTLTVLTALSNAQSRLIVHWIPIFTNYVTNPGFENGYTAWDRSLSYFENDEVTYMNLGQVTSDAHTGSHGLDMELGYAMGYNGYYHSDLTQTLATPVAVSSLWDASVWCQSSGNYINLVATYTDNTQTYANFHIDSYAATAGNNGFVQWNFLPMLNQAKTIKAIDFYADSYAGSDVVIDDVSLTTIRWIYIG